MQHDRRPLPPLSTWIVFLFLLAGLPTAVLGSGPPRDFSEAFEALKGLVGTWEAEGKKRTVRFRYHLTGNGSAVVETVYGDDLSNTIMSTVYHLDGERLMLTHYCGAGNQPRIQASVYDPRMRLLRFERFLDVTNLSAAEAYYTRYVEIDMEDPDHLRVRFEGLRNGEPLPVEYRLVRIGAPNGKERG